MRLTKRTVIPGTAVVLLGGIAFFAVEADALSGCGRTGNVAAPPVTAPAGQVVRSYLDAVVAHDRDTIRALSLPSHYAAEDEAVDSPYCNWKNLSNLKVDPPVTDRYEPGGYSQAVSVWVNFDLKQKHESSMSNGRTIWSYLLVRNADTERWRIADEGVG